MSILGAVAGLATSAIDMFVGGQLLKAKLEVDKSDKAEKHKGLGPVEFQFNPETIQIVRFSPYTSVSTAGVEKVAPRTVGAPTRGREDTIAFSNITFDTYEEKPQTSVYDKYIKKLEQLTGCDESKHAPPRLILTWGTFSGERKADLELKCYIDKLDVTYTMFLNDGKPVRAIVKLSVMTGLPPEEQEVTKTPKSPDHAKLVTVKRGDTLADIAFVEYHNPAEWRRIADVNGIDDPLILTPGMKLIVPPILS